jgi:subtilase family serine protease
VKTLKTGILTLFLVLVMLPSAMAQHAALPYPDATTPKPIDLGELKAQSGTSPISVTIALRLPKLDDAEKLLISLHTPGDPQFHQFLTADQFVARFAPTNADVAKVIAALAKYGLTAERTTATTLRVTGLPADLERAFSVSLHSYEVPAHGTVAGYTFHAPLAGPTVPAEISAAVVALVGLDSRPAFRPAHGVASQRLSRARTSARLTAASATPDAPGYWTVTDFADYYDVQPLYSQGITGSGRTLGIVTLASFTPSDAFTYWSALGLTVNPNRLSIVNVDGGPGAPSDASGSDETTLDVEQSGGVAPGANVIVYQAPNTNQAWVDAFAAAVEANLADTVSTSWCTWEWFVNLENGPVTDPITGQTVGFTQAAHELFVRAAIQGQTFFAASADGGAYTMNWLLGCVGPYSASQPYSCSEPLTVDYPASDPAMTAAGGTTLAATMEFCLNAACTPPYYTINVPHERVWGLDYEDGYCATLGYNPKTCGIFPYGSGGGVSIMFEKPFYQYFLPGTQSSRPGQIYRVGAAIASEDEVPLFYALPSDYPGRNVPDVSFNADWNTGYILYYTSSVSGFGISSFWGGTSFVAPQLNGVSALLDEDLHQRIGLLNFPLYGLALTGQAYTDPHPPLHAIKYGDNWFYHGSDGYNPGVGLGTLDVANFADVLRGQF